MIDVIALALGAAQQILSGVLTEAFIERRVARRRQIEREAMERAAAHPGLSKSDVDILTARIVSEVRYLVHEHPDLEWRMGRIQVVPPVQMQSSGQPNATNALLRERLERLNRITRTRWEQLREEPAEVVRRQPTGPGAVPPPKQVPQSSGQSQSEAGAEIIAVRNFNTDNVSYWRQRLEGMRQNVQADQRQRSARETAEPPARKLHEGGATTPLPEPPSAS